MLLYFLFIKPLLYILALLPLWLIQCLGRVTGGILNIIPNRHKSITLTNLNLAFPNLSDIEINNLCKKSLVETSKTFFEAGYVWITLPGKPLPSSIEVEGFHNVLESINKGGGVILFTPHQANIEIILNFLGNEIDCLVPFSKAKNKYLNSFVEVARKKMGVGMADVNMSGVKNLLNYLRSGKVVAIASDQVPLLSGGEMSKFFGQECLSMSLLSKLSIKTDAKVHSMVCVREEGAKGFKILFSQKLEMPHTIKLGVDTMNKELEKCIMLAPEQYAWEYKKYRRAGIKNLYN